MQTPLSVAGNLRSSGTRASPTGAILGQENRPKKVRFWHAFKIWIADHLWVARTAFCEVRHAYFVLLIDLRGTLCSARHTISLHPLSPLSSLASACPRLACRRRAGWRFAGRKTGEPARGVARVFVRERVVRVRVLVVPERGPQLHPRRVVRVRVLWWYHMKGDASCAMPTTEHA